MKDKNGKYWCLNEPDNHIHIEPHCNEDFKRRNHHVFQSIDHEDNSNVPKGQCRIKTSNGLFLKLKKDQLEAVRKIVSAGDQYQFVVNYIENQTVSIFSVAKSKFLKLEGHHAKAKADSYCGEPCHFIIEEINYSATEAGTKLYQRWRANGTVKISFEIIFI